jgi:pSer/pThr/pTyr-binding forkhead associated (FHA) protein
MQRREKVNARLFCKTGQLSGAEFRIGTEATIGTKPENSIVLYPNIISGKHARIFYDEKEESYVLEDLDSRNGTMLDGMKVTHQEKLENLHVITFAGMFDFIFQTFQGEKPEKKEAYKAAPTEAGKTIIEEGAVKTPIPSEEAKVEKTVYDDQAIPLPDISGEKELNETSEVDQSKIEKTIIDEQAIQVPKLSSEKPPIQGEQKQETPKSDKTYVLRIEAFNKTYQLKNGEYCIGRAVDCDIVIDDPSISRKHALIKVTPEKITIQDLGSKNKTYKENEQIDSEVEVSHDTRIRIGEIETKIIAE